MSALFFDPLKVRQKTEEGNSSWECPLQKIDTVLIILLQ